MEKNKCPLPELQPNPQIEIKIGIKNSISDSGFCLPLDILACILSRLPAKSIARLRCVCKQWNSLTHDPKFLSLHHEKGSARRFFRRCTFTGKIYSYDFDFEHHEIMFRPEESHVKIKDITLTCHSFSNSIKGLTCAYCHVPNINPNIYILNPTTGEHLILPTPPTVTRDVNGQYTYDHLNKRCHSNFGQSIGLGSDESTGEFKVVRLTYDRFHASMPIHCQILTIGSGEWRSLAEIPCNHYSSGAVFLNGVLHWIVGEHTDHMIGDINGFCQSSILTLDIKEETYGPMIPVTDAMCLTDLVDSGGHICVVFETGDKWFEVWKLKDYASHKWNKEYRFHLPDVPENTDSRYPLFVENDKILLQFRERLTARNYLYFHDHRGNTYYKLPSAEINWLGIYRDSLISPIGLTNIRNNIHKRV